MVRYITCDLFILAMQKALMFYFFLVYIIANARRAVRNVYYAKSEIALAEKARHWAN